MSSEGRNKVARSLLDLQPTAVLELFKLYVDRVNKPGFFVTFHGGSNFGGNVTWQGLQYLPIPIETEGFGVFGDGTLPRPKIRVANTDKIITALLQKYKDFKNGILYRKKVFIKHLDDVNFDGGNPFGQADADAEISEEKYFFGQKVTENTNYVEFELNLPLDLENFQVNQRTINAKYCYWQYRGLGCRYDGKPIERSNGEKFKNQNGQVIEVNLPDDIYSSDHEYNQTKNYIAGTGAYLENKNIIIDRTVNNEPIYLKNWYVCVADNNLNNPQTPEDNPLYWQLDNCSKKISACKKRFSPSIFTNSFWSNEEQSFYRYVRNINNFNEYDHYNYSAPDTTGLFFKTENSVFTNSNGVLTYKQNSPDFTVTTWLRVRSFQNDSHERAIIATNEVARTESTSNNIQFIDKNNCSGFHLTYRNRQDTNKLFVKTNETVASIDQSSFFNDDFQFFSVRWNKDDGLLYFGRGDNPNLFTIERQPLPDSSTNSKNDFFSIFCDYQPDVSNGYGEYSFVGDLAHVSVWSGFLSDNQLIELATLNKDSNTEKFTPVIYQDRPSDLDLNMVAWWDMQTGLGGSIIKDEHIDEINLTGYGHTSFVESEIDYTKITKSTFEVNESAGADPYLPFGGFPGTDGYDYK